MNGVKCRDLDRRLQTKVTSSESSEIANTLLLSLQRRFRNRPPNLP